MAATGELVGGQADAADVLDHANKHSGRHDQLPHSNLYVKGLPASHLDPESVRRLFEAYGGVESVRVVKYERARNTRAFAFVRMTDTAGAAAALGLHGSHLHGAALAVTLADADARDRPQKEGQEPSPCPTVYIKHVPVEWGPQQLAELFAPFGPVDHVRLLQDSASCSYKTRTAAALVQLESVEAAAAAIAALHDQQLEGSPTPLVVRFADPSRARQPLPPSSSGGGGGARSCSSTRSDPSCSSLVSAPPVRHGSGTTSVTASTRVTSSSDAPAACDSLSSMDAPQRLLMAGPAAAVAASPPLPPPAAAAAAAAAAAPARGDGHERDPGHRHGRRGSWRPDLYTQQEMSGARRERGGRGSSSSCSSTDSKEQPGGHQHTPSGTQYDPAHSWSQPRSPREGRGPSYSRRRGRSHHHQQQHFDWHAEQAQQQQPRRRRRHRHQVQQWPDREALQLQGEWDQAHHQEAGYWAAEQQEEGWREWDGHSWRAAPRYYHHHHQQQQQAGGDAAAAWQEAGGVPAGWSHGPQVPRVTSTSSGAMSDSTGADVARAPPSTSANMAPLRSAAAGGRAASTQGGYEADVGGYGGPGGTDFAPPPAPLPLHPYLVPGPPPPGSLQLLAPPTHYLVPVAATYPPSGGRATAAVTTPLLMGGTGGTAPQLHPSPVNSASSPGRHRSNRPSRPTAAAAGGGGGREQLTWSQGHHPGPQQGVLTAGHAPPSQQMPPTGRSAAATAAGPPSQAAQPGVVVAQTGALPTGLPGIAHTRSAPQGPNKQAGPASARPAPTGEGRQFAGAVIHDSDGSMRHRPGRGPDAASTSSSSSGWGLRRHLSPGEGRAQGAPGAMVDVEPLMAQLSVTPQGAAAREPGRASSTPPPAAAAPAAAAALAPGQPRSSSGRSVGGMPGNMSGQEWEDAAEWTTIKVQNLPEYATSLLLYQTFGPVGAILTAHVKTNLYGTCTGTGYVTFRSAQDAAAAARFSGRTVGPCTRPVHIILVPRPASSSGSG